MAFLGLFGVLLTAAPAFALVLQAPRDGEPIALPHGRVLCGGAPEGWVFDAGRRRLRPRASTRVGQTAEISIAGSSSACGSPNAEPATLVVTGPQPVIDPATVTLWVDAGRLELRGDGLEGARIGWRGGRDMGSDVCLNVTKDKGHDVCSIGVDKSLPADPRAVSLRWAPPGGRVDPDVITYDRAGNPVPDEALQLPVGRVLVQQVFQPSRTADVTSGEGHVELLHPEAVSSAECGVARCEVAGPGILVRAVPAASTTITVRLRLLPRVFL
ncbi:MAG: hypothetical protein JOZ69_04245, partial [Myxococcales bacterium]|nr:hypothetical protein [Myxococcales bacterium]